MPDSNNAALHVVVVLSGILFFALLALHYANISSVMFPVYEHMQTLHFIANRYNFLEDVAAGWGEGYLRGVILYIIICCVQVVVLLVYGGRQLLYDTGVRIFELKASGVKLLSVMFFLLIVGYVIFIYDAGSDYKGAHMVWIFYPFPFYTLCALFSYITSTSIYVMIGYVLAVSRYIGDKL